VTAAERWIAPAVDTVAAAACEWWAVSRERSGGVVTLAGVSLLRFDDDGRVVEQRDYWSSRPGTHLPPDGWGPVLRHA
jgi:hypothetical protein